MIIHKVALGNSNEAYIESKFSNSLNIISSDDNNRGKTILIQSMMYAFGNVPAFPSTFNFSSYYHVVEFSEGKNRYLLCRKEDVFILKTKNTLMMFNSVSELKRYWTKNIFRLPKILKNGLERIVDPELFVQLFFVGQDKKDTSNIANRGFYNKDDFHKMLYSFANLEATGKPTENIDETKRKIRNLKEEKKTLLKQYKILKSTRNSVNYLSSVNDRISFKNKIEQIDKIKNKILELKKGRNAALSRKSICEVTLKELNSLNRTISAGELRCMDCNSTHIGFSSSSKTSYSFDVSTSEIRNQIINSIKDKISAYEEDIERYTLDINNYQEEMQKSLSAEEISLEVLIAYKQDVYNASDAEKRINEIDNKIKTLEDSIQNNKSNSEELVKKQSQLLNDIIACMDNTYKQIDPSGNLKFESLFTKKNQIFSGSEATLYHLVKLYSLARVLDYSFPIIIDSFRAEDLSTEKEEVVLKLFSKLGVQVIFTTTLKVEEVDKYNDKSYINHIDYSSHVPSKILNSKYLTEFRKILLNIAIKI